MTAELIRWRGGPGAGKSTALVEYVRSEVTAGMTIDDLAVMTFSRSQAADLAGRIHATVFPDASTKAILRMCSTIHACGLRQCMSTGLIEDPRKQVIQHGGQKNAAPYQTFMTAHGLEYDPTIGTDDDEDRSRADQPIGNQLIAINAYLQATLHNPDEWREAAAALGLAVPGYAWPIADLLRAWRAYKAEHGLFEHEDYVRLALDRELPPPAPILFIDEYQDVNPAQAALIGWWVGHPDTRRVYVAGDEDQSIYGFRGCDPGIFLGLPAEDRGARPDGTRPTSHRCPVRVMQTAELILGHPANVSPCNRKGQVHHIRPEGAEGLAKQVEESIRYARTLQGEKQPVFVLSRFRKGAGNLAYALSAAGVPCSGIKPGRVNFWNAARIGRSRDNLEKVKVNLWTLKKAIARYLSAEDTEPIPLVEAEALILSTLTGEKRDAALKDLKIKGQTGPIRLYDIHGWLGGNLRRGIFDRLNMRPWIARQIRACLAREARRGYEITPEQVRVDTIHAAKGLEAAVVLLHTGYLRGRLDDLRIPERRAEERRVYFTGATRASHALLILDYGPGPTCPLLAGVTA
jgi:superfamily I DNA/RNA helicase